MERSDLIMEKKFFNNTFTKSLANEGFCYSLSAEIKSKLKDDILFQYKFDVLKFLFHYSSCISLDDYIKKYILITNYFHYILFY